MGDKGNSLRNTTDDDVTEKLEENDKHIRETERI